MSAYPKSLISIVASVAGLAVFLVLASLFLVSQPIGPTISWYFSRVNQSQNFDSISLVNGTHENSPSDQDIDKYMNTAAVFKSEEMVDQPRGKPAALNEAKVNNVSLSDNRTVEVPQLSMDVFSSVSPVQGNISKTQSAHSGSTIHHITISYLQVFSL